MLSKVHTYYKQLPISITKMLLAALMISVFFVLKKYTYHLINEFDYQFSWLLNSLKIGIAYLLWVVLTPLVYFLTKMLQSRPKLNALKIMKFIFWSIMLSITHQIIASRCDDLFNFISSGYLKSFLGANNSVIIIIGSFSSFIELLVVVAIFLALDYQKRYLLNQKALIASQLNALRMQLHPHFLFNTLHSIASMIDIDTKNAQKMLSKLGSLLRSMLEYEAEQMVTVNDELNFIKDYLDLEQVRYQDRVSINYSIEKEAMHLKIPNMIFQPLVENAVKYGIIPTIDNGKIDITVKLEHSQEFNEDVLSMEISNTFDDESNYTKPISTGVGLANISQRLEQFYNNRFMFKSAFETPKLYVAKMALPIIK